MAALHMRHAERRVDMASSRASVHSSSMHSLSDQIGAKVRNMAHIGRPIIDINFDKANGAHGAYVTSYSTMDIVSGTVSITAPLDTRFEDIEIVFLGEAKAHVDRMAPTPPLSGRTDATHRFLTLKQPINEAELPQPRILLAGKTYSFAFAFTLPSQLLPRSCSHPVASDQLRHLHLQLPPSLGDPTLAGWGGTLMDDLAPEMSRIEYAVKARITQVREADGAVTTLMDQRKKVRVKPAFEEQPPLNLDPFDPEYRLRQEKTVRKGVFKGKLGTLIMQTSQPKPLVMRTSSNGDITTMAKVLLRFDPADEHNTPPKLGSLASRIKVSTYFSTSPRRNLPSRTAVGLDLSQGVYQETINLSSLCVASAQWEKHSSDANSEASDSRRGSDSSDSALSESSFFSGILTPSKNYQGNYFYTAEIHVPITLPKTKNFIPTFHSCLISRTYIIFLNLSIHSAGALDPTFSLKVPVQICAEGSESGAANARARNAEISAVQEANEVLTPRNVAPSVNVADDLPPEYAVYSPRHRAHGHGYVHGVSVVG